MLSLVEQYLNYIKISTCGVKMHPIISKVLTVNIIKH